MLITYRQKKLHNILKLKWEKEKLKSEILYLKSLSLKEEAERKKGIH